MERGVEERCRTRRLLSLAKTESSSPLSKAQGSEESSGRPKTAIASHCETERREGGIEWREGVGGMYGASGWR